MQLLLKHKYDGTILNVLHLSLWWDFNNSYGYRNSGLHTEELKELAESRGLNLLNMIDQI